jgi:hypothetical protein
MKVLNGMRLHSASLVLAGVLTAAATGMAGAVAAAEAVNPAEFAWRGNLVLPAGASLARVDLPVEALLRLQSSAAQDVRVFNAAGEVVPFAVLRKSDVVRATPVVQTRAYAAHPLFTSSTSGKPAGGAVEVRVDASGNGTSAWVRWDGNAGKSLPADAQPLQAALFDTRAEKQTLAALDIKGEWPRNALVHLELASSDDLLDWTPLPVKGPLFRFDGADAPSNSTLELQQAQSLQGRYLRLRWAGQEGVKVQSFTARVAATLSLPAPVRAALPAGTPDGSSLTWALPFATPMAALHLQALQDNTLVPVRISGRNDAAQLWRTLASSVVYRLDTVGQGSSNAPVALQGASVRALRVESSNGLPLPSGGLQATVEFAPVQLAFLASGAGPYTLAAGRANTAAAAVDAGLLGSVSSAKLAELPVATVQQLRADAPDAPHVWAAALLPAGTSLRSLLLWGVLLVGVLVLAGVAYSLLRQLNTKP